MDSITNIVAISSSKTRGQIERCELREQIRPPKLRRPCRTRRLRFTSRVGQGCPDSPLLRPTSKLNCGWGTFETINECESKLNLWYVR